MDRPRDRGPKNPWLVRLRLESTPLLRLFCFPYAGGGATIYRDWAPYLPLEIEPIAIQLPGHQTRLAEPSATRLDRLIEPLGDAIVPLADVPFAFFGHSMGALIGFEMARALRRTGGPSPIHLAMSGRRAPQILDTDQPIHDLPDTDFLAAVRDLNGTPVEFFANRELVDVYLHTLRADITLCETYHYVAESPLDCSITAYGGLDDPKVSRTHLAPWQAQTTGVFFLRMLPGDHFFLHGAQHALLDAVCRDVWASLQQSSR